MSRDEFEEFRARAISGGSLYGLLRRRGLLNCGDSSSSIASSHSSGDDRPLTRPRSKSLLPEIGGPTPTLRLLNPILTPLDTEDEEDPLPPPAPGEPRPRRYSAAGSDAAHIIASSAEIKFAISPPPVKPPFSAEHSFESAVTVETRCDDLSPDSPRLLRPPDTLSRINEGPTLMRRRSFSISRRGGVVPEGELLVSRIGNSIVPAHSVGSELEHLERGRSRASSVHSNASLLSTGSSDTPIYRVLMLGASGVGKTALATQFMTSECMGAQNCSFDDGVECTVTVLLDGREAVMDFMDFPDAGDDTEMWRQVSVDAYLIVYALTDRTSYDRAIDILHDIRRSDGSDAPIILVANKIDLARARSVLEVEGKSAAVNYDCKYIEVSAALSHRVDELLVGMLKQIRLNPQKKKQALGRTRSSGSWRRSKRPEACGGGSARRPNFVRAWLRSSLRQSRSCEDLLNI